MIRPHDASKPTHNHSLCLSKICRQRRLGISLLRPFIMIASLQSPFCRDAADGCAASTAILTGFPGGLIPAECWKQASATKLGSQVQLIGGIATSRARTVLI